MSIETNRNYSEIARPYNNALERSLLSDEKSLLDVGSTPEPESKKEDNKSTQSSDVGNGSVETMPVKTDGAIGDVWIKNFIRSVNWKPKKVGFAIDGQTGKAEFTGVYISGEIEALTGTIGEWKIGADYIRDVAGVTGMSSVVTVGDDIRFWAGHVTPTSAPFYVTESGALVATSATITGVITATTGAIGGFTITATELYGGIIKTAATVASGSNGVIMDTAGLRGYDSVLGKVFDLPTDGSAPTFSSGIINYTTFNVNTNAVIRTSETVGDGTVNSAGILIDNTGLYGCQASQTLANANIKVLIDGSVVVKGTMTIDNPGDIAGSTITNDSAWTDDTVANQALSDAAQAILDAADAQGTADGKVTTFYQTGIPTSLAIGDLWIDTDDTNKLYRAEIAGADQIIAGEWVIVRDTGIATAISNAATAQSTADSKIVTFYQSAIPTATDAGDFFYDTDDGKTYRSTSIGDTLIQVGQWERIDVGLNPSLIDALQTTNAPAAANADVTQTKIDGGIITTGYITLGTAGNIKSGKDNYADATAGFWLGSDGATPKFNIGDATDSLKWDGSTLIVNGAINLTNASTVRSDINVADGADVTSANSQLVTWLTSNVKIDTIFETSGRFYTTAGGTGSAVFGNNGAMLQPGATATSYARMLLYTTDYVLYNEPIFSCILTVFNKGTLDGRFAVGLGDITVDGSGFTEVNAKNFCGFYLKKAAGAVTLAIFQQKDDDTYDFENNVSVVNNSDILELFMKIKSTGITYYYRRNGGALTTIATLTTGNPHGNIESAIYFANTNMGDASNFQVQLKSVSYEK